jgi:hypothetical protein
MAQNENADSARLPPTPIHLYPQPPTATSSLQRSSRSNSRPNCCYYCLSEEASSVVGEVAR